MFKFLKAKGAKVSIEKNETKTEVKVVTQILRESVETVEMPELVVKTTMANGKVFTETLKPGAVDDRFGYCRWFPGNEKSVHPGHFIRAEHNKTEVQDCGTKLNHKHILYSKSTPGALVTVSRKVLKLEEV